MANGTLKRYNGVSWDPLYVVPKSHDHAISEVVSLQDTLNAKLGDAPSDGIAYNRQDGSWAAAATLEHTHPEYDHEKSGWDDDAAYTLSINETTRVVTITPTGTSNKYWSNGTEYEVTVAQQVTIANVTGRHYIYAKEGSFYTKGSTAWDRKTGEVPVVLVVWNATQGKKILLGYEAHTWFMDYKTHIKDHLTQGTKYQVGGDLIVLGGDTTVSVTPLTMWDEDLSLQTGVNVGVSQVLNALQAPVIFRDGLAADAEIYDIGTSTIAYLNGGQPKVNTFNGSTWAKEDVGNNSYFCYWLLHTNDVDHAFVWAPGQESGANLSTTLANNDIRTFRRDTLDAEELVIVGRLTMKATNGGYTIEQWDVYDLDSNDAITQVLEAHIHTEADIVGLDKYTTAEIDAALALKSDTTHGHTIGDVTSLQTSLDAKAPLVSPLFTGTPQVNGNLDLWGANLDRFFYMGSGVGGSYGYKWEYHGTGSGNDNSYHLWADNQGGADVEVFRVLQNGAFDFKVAATINGQAIVKNDDGRLTDARTPTSHNHTESEITDLGSYALSTHNHDATYKAIGYVPSWGEITGKPSTFTPSVHTHTESQITDLGSYALSGHSHSYLPLAGGVMTGTITGDLIGRVYAGSTGAPDNWIFSVSEQYPTWGMRYNEGSPDRIEFVSSDNTTSYITLDTGLGYFAGLYVGGTAVVKTDDSRLSDARTPVSHTHTESEITDLGSYALSTHNHTGVYAPVVHNHDADYKDIGWVPGWGDITGKPSTFTPSAHEHSITEINNLIESTSFSGNYSPMFYIGADNRMFTHTGIDFTGSTNILNVDGGYTVGGTAVVLTNDSRLSDARTPTAHNHTFASLTSKPTTLAGFGITDADTSAEVDAKISALVDAAPGTLDTLNELAAALGDDPNFATTVANDIAGKAPLVHNHDADYSDINHNHTGVYEPVHSHPYAPTVHTHTEYLKYNPDGDGIVIAYDDSNPNINGQAVGGGHIFGADGNVSNGYLAAKVMFAEGVTHSVSGYYVGSLSRSTGGTATKIADSTGKLFATGSIDIGSATLTYNAVDSSIDFSFS